MTDSPVSSAQDLAPVTPPPPPIDGILLSGGTGANNNILVIGCGNCAARNVMEMMKDYYYVVFKGWGAVGVFRSLVSVSLSLVVPI